MDAVVIEAIGIAAALFGAGFCSGASSALNDLQRDEPGEFDETDDASSKADEVWNWWSDRRRAVSMVLAIGHRLGIIVAVVLGSILLGRFVEWTVPLTTGFVAGVTLLAVVLSDVIPGTIARSNPQRFGLTALRMLRGPYLLLYPLIRPLLGIRDLVARLFGDPKAEKGRDDRATARLIWERLLAARNGSSSERRQLLRSVAEFPTTRVREVMIPRTDMVTISEDMKLDEILVTLLECGHSRIPVHGETLDDIVGLFYAKDIIQLMASGRDFVIEDFLREPYFVPETKPISDLLTEFQRERIHLAVVVDEFGGTEGLITLEDIIEEFFGDIQDEYDVEPSQLVELSPTTVLADARIGIDEIEEHFDVELPREGEYDSLGGFLLDQTGGVPETGEEIESDSLLFRVMDADARRVDTVEIEVHGQPSEPAELVS